MEADQDHDGKISFEEFTKMVENTDVSMSMTLGAHHTASLGALVPKKDRLLTPFFHRSILAVIQRYPRDSARRLRFVLDMVGTIMGVLREKETILHLHVVHRTAGFLPGRASFHLLLARLEAPSLYPGVYLNCVTPVCSVTTES